jgi:hypothetical protein
MSKRARNDGLDTARIYPAGDIDAFHRRQPLDEVEPGHYLSGDLPQELHKEIGARDGWSLVDYSPPGSKTPKGEE